MHNLPKTSSKSDPRIEMFIYQRARKRYHAIQNIAKTLRLKAGNSVQTSLRNGRRDFLLRQKPRGDSTPWNQVPPLKLDENIPDFEIGEYNNIYENEIEEVDPLALEDQQDMQDLSNEIRRQYQQQEELVSDI